VFLHVAGITDSVKAGYQYCSETSYVGSSPVCFETQRRKVAATSCRTVSVASVACIEVEWCSVVVFTNTGEVNLGESLGTVSDA